MNANISEKGNLLDLAIFLEQDGAMFWLIDEKGAIPTSQNVESAKLSSNEAIKKWGHQYGTFLNRYNVKNFKDKIHESLTCHVFGVSETEIEPERADSKGGKTELVLKFMNDKSG